uniref:Uncharacterized protein n=1 Tax=Bactrocera dorsalis TaxID=27457 RepID=A0A034W3J4_BACDO
MYGIKNCTSVNDARYRIFQKNYSANKSNEQFLRKVRSFNSNTIPPCWKSLKQKILRTIYVNAMWLNATDPYCAQLQPQNCGWHIDEKLLKPIEFLGDPTPLQVDDILPATIEENDDDNSEFDFNIASSDESDNE